MVLINFAFNDTLLYKNHGPCDALKSCVAMALFKVEFPFRIFRTFDLATINVDMKV